MTISVTSDEAYRQAGVDLKRADTAVSIAKRAAQKTASNAITGSIGQFAGAFELPAGYKQPVLLTGCDGVGTKLKLALEADIHNTVGIDLVAMSVNDILANGGEPLVFLDYVATGKINPQHFEAILEGIAEGCRQANCKLSGGETAEMPGFYPNGEYDLAGFCVGVSEKAEMYPKAEHLKAGDAIIGLASSGLHSNGYSLVRKIVADNHVSLQSQPTELSDTVAKTLLTPTKIYVKPVLDLLKQYAGLEKPVIKALIHNTGGGFIDNIPRVFENDTLSAEINTTAWQPPQVFEWLKTLGQLDTTTMMHTFNMGIGFMLIVESSAAVDIIECLNKLDDTLQAKAIGRLVSRDGQPSVIMTEY